MQKLIISLITIFISMFIVFFVIYYMPGDPVEILAQEIIRQENLPYYVAYQRAITTLNYNPDEPIISQLSTYLKGIVSGDLGYSLTYQKPVIEVIAQALPWTLLILGVALVISFIIGVLIGAYLALKASAKLNIKLLIYQSVFGAVPDYIVAYILIFIFSVTLKWLPSKGAYTSSVTVGFNLPFIVDVAKHATLPVLAYFLTTVSTWIVNMRANAVTVMGEEYITYAVIRGLPKKTMLIHYLGKNSILPMISNLAVAFGMMFGGSPLIENLFLYPGVGYYLNIAINRRDFPLMQGMFFVMIIMLIMSNLIAEYVGQILNPRLKGESYDDF
ncbi:MAG: peptide ABC transporter permease [Epulopiscium sp. Nele67-Bin005]|nr:MAG: peptide ABC transporter permease [Epulopiscium sp. Nele67-Bin005]